MKARQNIYFQVLAKKWEHVVKSTTNSLCAISKNIFSMSLQKNGNMLIEAQWYMLNESQYVHSLIFTLVRIPHCDSLTYLTWIRPISPILPSKYKIFNSSVT